MYSIIFISTLNKNFSKITMAGHSLGEYCALYFAESLKFEEMLEVVKYRGDSMSIVSDPEKYVMYAILKKENLNTLSVEGIRNGDWVLVDAGDIIIHLFRSEVREYYGLEKMWAGEEINSYIK